MGGSLLGIGIVAVIGAVIVGAVVISIVAAVVRWRDRVKVACCGSCRYPVEGLTALKCPECGSDFRSAGILVPGVRPKHRIHVAELFAAWMALALPGGFLTLGGLSAAPGGNRTWFSRTETLTPASGTFGGVTVTWTGSAPTGALNPSTPATTASLWIQSKALKSTLTKLEIDYKDRTWELIPYSAPGGRSRVQKPLPVPEADVASWVTSFGTAGTPPAAEVAGLTAYLNGAGVGLDQGAFSSVAGMTTAVTAPARWVMVTSAGSWVVIFIAGCVLIARAHSTRKRREPRTSGAKTA